MINKMEKPDYNVHPPHLYEGYKSTIFRSPTQPLVPVASMLKDISMPAFGNSVIRQWDNDLTKNGRRNGEPIGERIKMGDVKAAIAASGRGPVAHGDS